MCIPVIMCVVTAYCHIWCCSVFFVNAVYSLPEYFAILSSLSDSDVKAALSKAREMCFPVSIFYYLMYRVLKL